MSFSTTDKDESSPNLTGPENSTNNGASSRSKRSNPAQELANKNIRELNKIDEEISELLLSGGLAIKSLTTPVSTLESLHPAGSDTNSTLPDGDDNNQKTAKPTLQSQQAAFRAHAARFQTLLDSVRIGLRRQILAQEKAEILAPVPPATAASSSGPGGGAGVGGAAGSTGGVTGAGVGLDVGALNIKSDSVGKDMEAELWRKAKLFIEEIERQGDEDGAGAQLMQENGDRDVSMGNV